MIKQYYYNQQIKSYIMAFANIFTGLTVKTGKGGCGEISSIEVPIQYASIDRVVAAIGSRHTQNLPHQLPIMSCYMNGINLAPDRLHGVNLQDRKSYMEQGGVYPQDVQVIRRVMAIPFNLEMELSVYASNTDQAFQMLEQLLMLFDYDLQLQINDAPFDWAKITKLILTGINNEEQVPIGTDKRTIIWTFQFDFPIWISPPYDLRKDLISQVNIDYGEITDEGGKPLTEIDEDGNDVPFDLINIGDHFDPSKLSCIGTPQSRVK